VKFLSRYILLFWLIFFLLFGESSSGAFAQTYPVQLTTQLVPPYSGYLPDYASPGGEKLHVIILLKDLTKPIYAVKLSLKIEGQNFSMQTKSYFKCPVINIDPGIPAEISPDILDQLLDSKNLDFIGINKNDYEQRKALPEGYYKICFTAYDYYNPVSIQVSNESCASAWMTLSDPPQLNLPLCGSTVNTSSPQQIIFNWMPMNMGSPNSAQNSEYVFELWEIHPDGADPNNIAQTLPPVYSVTTDFTTLNYGITETLLNPGMQYAWRVRAKDKNGYDNFKNKGYSTVCTFRYGSKYEGLGDALKLNLQAIPLTSRMAKLVWDSVAAYDHYTVNYRKQGWPDWFETIITNSSTKAHDLEPLTIYEARVQGTTADGYVGSWSNTAVFKTPSLAQYACGDAPMGIPQQNTKSLPAAFPGMVLQVGQFEMLVTQIQGSNGYFSGLGRINAPFVGTLNVSYTNIYVNEDRVMIMGQVKALSEGIDAWLLGNNTIKTGKDSTDINVNFIIKNESDIKVDTASKTITIIGTDGNPVIFIYTPPLPTTITDKAGNIYVIDKNGKPSLIGKSGTGKGAIVDSKNILNTKNAKADFKVSSNQQYGFDGYQYAHLNAYYPVIKDITTAKEQAVNWKSVETAKPDALTADLDFTNSGDRKLKPDSIYYVTGTGTIYNRDKKTNEVTIIGGPDHDGQELFAAYKTGKDSVTFIGKIDIASYQKVKNKLVLIPLLSTEQLLKSGLQIDKLAIQKTVNQIYAQAIAEWEVDIAPPLTPESGWDKNNNNNIAVSSDMLSMYSEEMKELNKQLRNQTYYDKNTFYLFISSIPPEGNLEGEMPRGRHIGYIFTQTQGKDLAKVIAHELGHGAFNLGHPFAEFKNVAKGSTDNLMDYGGGIMLNKYQWDQIHQPVNPAVLFDSDENAQMVDQRRFAIELLGAIKSAYVNKSAVKISSTNTGQSIVLENFHLEGISYSYIQVRTGVGKIEISPSNKIEQTETDSYFNGGAITKPKSAERALSCINIDNGVSIIVPKDRLNSMDIYLKSTLVRKNLLLFVNGYRPCSSPVDEMPKPPDVVSAIDINNYWSGIDGMFADRIEARNIVYADGHHSITTSNHKTQIAFLESIVSSGVSNTFCGGISFMTLIGYMPSANVRLNTTPNKQGFTEREANGTKAGADLIKKLNDGTIPCRKDIHGKIIDTVDVVAHSFGFAYSLGIINKFIQNNIHIGNFYILAPENACSGYIPAQVEEVWQYGTNEDVNQGGDPLWLQDGVAPQCLVAGIDKVAKGGRVFIPDGEKKGFLDSHYIDNYGWIFNRLQLTDKGYVYKRK
jgi:hypothetical protein